MPEQNRITVTDLIETLGTPGAPLVFDVCLENDFAEDPFLIPGAYRHSHNDLSALAHRVGGEPVVIVCQKGLKLSQGVAAWLRASGKRAAHLVGGAQAWRHHGEAPHYPASALPEPIDGHTLWVTQENASVEQLACLWLIRRFVDREACFLFVASDQVTNVADRFGATELEAFATPLVDHTDCGTFAAMRSRLHLTLPALESVSAQIHHAGVDAICDGFRHLGMDDLARLKQSLPVFDALFATARCTPEGAAV